MRGDEVKGTGLPAWLDGQTIAVIGTVLTVAVGISAMILVSTVGIRTQINDMDKGLTDRLNALGDRVRKVEQTVVAIQSSVNRLEERVRDVEVHMGESLETAHVVQRPAG